MNNNNNNNNNRNNNNRRRGRNNNVGSSNRPQGGGPQVNRIDSRARGNAPQLLEKYRKAAQDAHLNGDRVNAEYYLQFADHYFRVIADTRTRQEEARLRRDDRWQDNGEGGGNDESDDAGDFTVDADFPAFDQPPVYTRRDREDRPERAEPRPERSEQPPERQDRPDQRPQPQGSKWQDRSRGPDPAPIHAAAPAESGAGNPSTEPAPSVYEPEQNPFVRENRGSRGLRPRREDRGRPDSREDRGRPDSREDRGPAREDRDEVAAAPGAGPTMDGPAMDGPVVIAGFDPASLPPAISAGRIDAEEPSDIPAPRRRARRKPSADDAGEALQSAN